MAGPLIFVLFLTALPLCLGSFFPPAVQGVNNKSTAFDPNIYVSSKDTSSICETTPKVKSYSGYVHMPAGSVELPGGKAAFPVNSFYWFFESRKDPQNAPFVLWLGGGPGFSSIASALTETGPCSVLSDSKTTVLNPKSWNNEANIIYIDSPGMVGFSYDRLVNGTIDATNESLPIVPSASNHLPDGNNTLQVGTFPSQDISQVSNSTGNTVPFLWTALQAWFSNFPQYKPREGRISIWTESYGGRYGPLTSEFIMQRTHDLNHGKGHTNAIPMTIDTLGLINAFVDPSILLSSLPSFVNNNTYGIQTVPPAIQASMQQNLTKPGGCLELLANCKGAADGEDAQDTGSMKASDRICSQAFAFCETNVQLAYDKAAFRDDFDISQLVLDPFPPQFALGFLGQAWVQQTLGAMVNFTVLSGAVQTAFLATGDEGHDGALAATGRLLDAGVQVALITGDRDYQVNWFAGEQISLQTNWSGTAQFRSAGYTNMTGSDDTVGGMTRQAGNFSFTRVFQSGHNVPAYQPAVALDLFTRAMAHRDLATGKISTSMSHTQGPSTIFDVRQDPPPMSSNICYTWELSRSCTPDQVRSVANGSAVVKDFVVQGGAVNSLAGLKAAAGVLSGPPPGSGSNQSGSPPSSSSGQPTMSLSVPPNSTSDSSPSLTSSNSGSAGGSNSSGLAKAVSSKASVASGEAGMTFTRTAVLLLLIYATAY